MRRLQTPLFGSNTGLSIVTLFGLLYCTPTDALASYSPPLTRVRIDQTFNHHTPSVVFARQKTVSDTLDLALEVNGLQYLGQFESKSGWGVQVGATIGTAKLTGTFTKLSNLLSEDFSLNANGTFIGWQARGYYMLWKSSAESNQRSHALTSFINLRGLFYDAEDRSKRTRIGLQSNAVTAGLGLMAEFSIHDYISICPYAWVTPNVHTKLTYGTPNVEFESVRTFGIRNPLVVGLDVWLYLFPPNWQDHISLSVLGSFIDTEDKGENFLAGVIGYTF